MVTEAQVREALKKVVDPELHLDIVSLGLVYEVKVNDEGDVAVKMTLTTPFCPIAPEFQQNARNAAESVAGVKSATVEIVFDPPWDPATMASEEAKNQLGLW